MTIRTYRFITFGLAFLTISIYVIVYLIYGETPKYDVYSKIGDFGLCLQLAWIFVGRDFIKK